MVVPLRSLAYNLHSTLFVLLAHLLTCLLIGVKQEETKRDLLEMTNRKKADEHWLFER